MGDHKGRPYIHNIAAGGRPQGSPLRRAICRGDPCGRPISVPTAGGHKGRPYGGQYVGATLVVALMVASFAAARATEASSQLLKPPTPRRPWVCAPIPPFSLRPSRL